MHKLLKLVVVGGSLIGVGLLGLGAFVSTVAPQGRGRSDSGITSTIQASLLANDKVKAGQVEVETRQGVVYLTGVVETEELRREAGRVGWSTEGVGRVSNEILVSGIDSNTFRTGGL